MYRTGMRQNVLARQLGIQEAQLSRIINGARRPGEALRARIAEALRENADWLFEMAGGPATFLRNQKS